MENPVIYLPVATTAISLVFAAVVWRRFWSSREKLHLLWWCGGIFVFGVGTFFESVTSVFGWEGWVFRGWYISGALLGGAPLAQGTVYLLVKRRTAHVLTVVLVAFIAVASGLFLASPIDASLAEEHRLSGEVIEWQWVRALSPFVNTYAAIFLIGGAIYSAVKFYGEPATRDRFIGSALIAVGAILPGIGGSFARFGYVEVLYVGEFVGLILIAIGYGYSVRERPVEASVSVPAAQPAGAAADG